MNMLLRMLFVVLRARRASRLGVWEVGRAAFTVRPTDLDVLKHMNNGVYLSLLDLGRLDLLIRNGVWRRMSSRGWYPVVASQTISYRRSLTLGQRFEIETRIAGADTHSVYVEQRFVRGTEVHAVAFVRARFLKKSGGTVPLDELLAAVGAPPTDRTVPAWVGDWAEHSRLPSTRAPFASDWAADGAVAQAAPSDGPAPDAGTGARG